MKTYIFSCLLYISDVKRICCLYTLPGTLGIVLRLIKTEKKSMALFHLLFDIRDIFFPTHTFSMINVNMFINNKKK